VGVVNVILIAVWAMLIDLSTLAAENLALRQQLAVLRHSVKRPKLRRRDRVFWVWLSQLWRNWRSVLVIVQPETVIRWHRGAADRLNPARMPGSHDRPQRGSSDADSECLFRVLPPITNASFA